MFFPASLIRIWTREEEKVRQHNSWLLDIYISNVYVIQKSKIFQFLLPNIPKKSWFCSIPNSTIKSTFQVWTKVVVQKKSSFQIFLQLTTKWDSLRDPRSITIANSSSRAQKLETSITRISGHRTRSHGLCAKFHGAVGGSSRKSTAYYRWLWKKKNRKFLVTTNY